MTTPAQPATGAGAPATGTASTEPAQTGQPSATDPATDWASIFDGMTPEEVKAKLDHSRTWETRAKANKKALDALQQSAKPAEGEPTAEDLKRQLTEHQEARQAAEDRAAELAYKDTVRSVATDTNLDAKALLDSTSFRETVADELGDDFTDADLQAAVAKVARSKDFAKNSRFAKTVGASRSGGEFNGAPASPASIDQQIEAATNARNFPLVISLKRQKAALNRQ